MIAPRGRGDVSVQPDGTIDGPGVTDNGAGLAALIALARALRENPPRRKPARNILLVANVAEEGEGNLHGMKYLCHHSPLASRINAFLVLDGASTGHITAEALGSRRFEITIEGPGGHSWNDYGTANPIHALSRTVAELSELELPSFPRTTLNVGVIEGGCVVNSIALIARAKVDIRSRRNSATGWRRFAIARISSTLAPMSREAIRGSTAPAPGRMRSEGSSARTRKP